MCVWIVSDDFLEALYVFHPCLPLVVVDARRFVGGIKDIRCDLIESEVDCPLLLALNLSR